MAAEARGAAAMKQMRFGLLAVCARGGDGRIEGGEDDGPNGRDKAHGYIYGRDRSTHSARFLHVNFMDCLQEIATASGATDEQRPRGAEFWAHKLSKPTLLRAKAIRRLARIAYGRDLWGTVWANLFLMRKWSLRRLQGAWNLQILAKDSSDLTSWHKGEDYACGDLSYCSISSTNSPSSIADKLGRSMPDHFRICAIANRRLANMWSERTVIILDAADPAVMEGFAASFSVSTPTNVKCCQVDTSHRARIWRRGGDSVLAGCRRRRGRAMRNGGIWYDHATRICLGHRRWRTRGPVGAPRRSCTNA